MGRLQRLWPFAAAAASALLLAAAHISESVFGLEPCELCLKQRAVYWAILVWALILGLIVQRRPQLARPAAFSLFLFFGLEAAVAIYHAGVEWRLWPGPASCTGGAGRVALTPKDMAGLLSGRPQKIVQCDVAAFRFLGLSMAGWNALVALLLAGVSLGLCRRPDGPDAASLEPPS